MFRIFATESILDLTVLFPQQHTNCVRCAGMCDDAHTNQPKNGDTIYGQQVNRYGGLCELSLWANVALYFGRKLRKKNANTPNE